MKKRIRQKLIFNVLVEMESVRRRPGKGSSMMYPAKSAPVLTWDTNNTQNHLLCGFKVKGRHRSKT